ncbi:hypothetical protein T492DRAFT_901530 [Pavlovales sp. CCMP2436]|nr:hypothetical protein T492DRAFT_901530 [Pavlovales sp. CCMP2436]
MGMKGAPPPTPADAGPQGRADALTSELAAVRAQLRLALELPAGAGEEGAMEYASLAERCGAEENILRWLCVARERELDDIELESDAVFALATSGPLASPPSRLLLLLQLLLLLLVLLLLLLLLLLAADLAEAPQQRARYV